MGPELAASQGELNLCSVIWYDNMNVCRSSKCKGRIPFPLTVCLFSVFHIHGLSAFAGLITANVTKIKDKDSR